jgi:hypothetical protein
LAGKQMALINCAGCPTLLFRVAAVNVIKLTQFAAPNVNPDLHEFRQGDGHQRGD